MLREHSPHAVAYATRCKPETLRDWRRAGHLEDLGHRDGKGHLFSLLDACRIATAVFLARAGIGLPEAFEIVRKRGPIIDAEARLRLSPSSAGTDYVLTISFNPDLAGFVAAVSGSTLANVQFDSEVAGALQVNVSSIVRSTLARIETFDRVALAG